ncbi:hypothetical protein [Sphingopyxis fribergensis]
MRTSLRSSVNIISVAFIVGVSIAMTIAGISSIKGKEYEQLLLEFLGFLVFAAGVGFFRHVVILHLDSTEPI